MQDRSVAVNGSVECSGITTGEPHDESGNIAKHPWGIRFTLDGLLLLRLFVRFRMVALLDSVYYRRLPTELKRHDQNCLLFAKL